MNFYNEDSLSQIIANVNVGSPSAYLQTDGDKILLFPAWPREWNVDFKLHAPGNTVIEGSLQNGKVTALTVNPPERQQNIKIAGK